MNTVLVHIGCQGPYIVNTEPPPHLERCIQQYLLFNKGDLFVLTDRANIPLLKQRPGVFPVPLEDYASDKADRFNARFNYASNEFWSVTTTRFMYLENFIRENRLAPVCHFENDVLVYFDISRYGPVFKRLYGPRMAATPSADDHLNSGFMYFGSCEALAHMTSYFVDMMVEYGVHVFEQKFGVDMVNDMTLMRRYADSRGAGGVGFLPVLPFGEFSAGYEEFKAIFDPADFGQYVTGTRTGGPGVLYIGHYIGGVLYANPDYKIVWQDEDGLRCPYFSYDSKLAKMNNLHVHSKNMEPYMSVARDE